ncbi:MAG: PAS domain-containing sensor histidine kinase, partial [Verrucomicrobiales bacterium]
AQEQSEKTPEPTTPDNVFAAAPVMLWTCDAKGHLTAVNRQWERFRGKTAEEGLDDAWLEAIASEDERQSTHRQLCEAAKEGKPLKCRFTWTDSDGASRVVELYGSPLVDSDGQCDGLTGAVRDITEECAVLSTVREVVAPENESPEAGVPSEIYQLLSSKLPGWRERQSLAASDLAAFREIFDHVGAGIVLLGANAKPLFANHRHRDLLGFSIEEAGDMESWLRRACGDQAHADAVMKIWHEDVWQRQLTKVLALKTANGALREIKLEPQLFLDDNRLLLTMHDVTESKRSEEAMRDSEIRFRALFRESSMGIALIDSEEKIYDINPALEKVLGVARRQILCRSFDECLNQEDLPKKQTVLKDLLASPRRSAMVELRLARPKADEEVSRVVWVRLHISLVRDVDQRVLFTAYFVQDITEQRQVQEELRISQEQNRALLEVIPNLILLVNRKGEVIDLMPGESQTIALEEEEAMGRPIGQVIPAFEGKFTKLIREAYSLDDVVHFQFTGPGENETYLARIVACKPESVIITIDQDRPVAQPAPAEIPEALQLQSMSFENGPDAVVITNYAGAILDWNPAAVALFGYEKSDALGQPLPALFGVDSVEALTRHLQPVDQSDRWSGQISFRRKDRSEGLADVVFRPLKGEGGRLAGQAAFIREAFVPPKVEVDPKAREALIEEIREDSMVKLVPQMHQRLRNNLQIIGTLLNLQFKGQTDPAMRQALRTSRNRAHTLLILHEQIRAQEDEEAINFQDLAEQVAENLLTSFDVSDRIQISVDIGDVLDLHAASPLSLILNELVSNAIRHGFPKTESGQVRISMKIADGKGHLAVSDDGIGEQASASSGSPGMGLQIVKTLANQIGGSLERIDTTETEFRVYFTTALRK